MTLPSQHLRDVREQRDNRRLAVAQALRENPNLTNVQLGDRFNVSRNTIKEDRDALTEQVKQATLTETQLLRARMCDRLEHLNTELELHRRDGKLPVSVIHEMLLVHRSVIELLGVRKPVVERVKHEGPREPVKFEVQIVPSSKQAKCIDAEVVQPRLLATKH